MVVAFDDLPQVVERGRVRRAALGAERGDRLHQAEIAERQQGVRHVAEGDDPEPDHLRDRRVLSDAGPQQRELLVDAVDGRPGHRRRDVEAEVEGEDRVALLNVHVAVRHQGTQATGSTAPTVGTSLAQMPSTGATIIATTNNPTRAITKSTAAQSARCRAPSLRCPEVQRACIVARCRATHQATACRRYARAWAPTPVPDGAGAIMAAAGPPVAPGPAGAAGVCPVPGPVTTGAPIEPARGAASAADRRHGATGGGGTSVHLGTARGEARTGWIMTSGGPDRGSRGSTGDGCPPPWLTQTLRMRADAPRVSRTASREATQAAGRRTEVGFADAQAPFAQVPQRRTGTEQGLAEAAGRHGEVHRDRPTLPLPGLDREVGGTDDAQEDERQRVAIRLQGGIGPRLDGGIVPVGRHGPAPIPQGVGTAVGPEALAVVAVDDEHLGAALQRPEHVLGRQVAMADRERGGLERLEHAGQGVDQAQALRAYRLGQRQPVGDGPMGRIGRQVAERRQAGRAVAMPEGEAAGGPRQQHPGTDRRAATCPRRR